MSLDAKLQARLRSYGRTLNRNQKTGPRTVTKVGVVTAVTPGTSVTVTVEGNNLTAPYLGTAPSITDVVRVELKDGSPTVTGRLTGVTVL